MGFLRRFFRRLFCGEEKECPREIILYSDSYETYKGNVGETLAKGVAIEAVYSDDGSPASGVEIRFYVVKGEVGLGGGRKDVRLKTDAEGRASVDLELTQKSYALIAAELPDKPEKALFFSGHTDGMTHQVFLYTEPVLSPSVDEVVVRISALDFHGKPVTGANLSLTLISRRYDIPPEGQVQELGNGAYVGRVKADLAGHFAVSVEDLDTLVIGTHPVYIQAGQANSFQFVGQVDPRMATPYDEVDLMVKLIDGKGNALPPTRINVTAKDGRHIPTVLRGNLAVMNVRSVGYSFVPIILTDTETGLRTEYSVEFAGVWLTDPGLVFQGDTYRTGIFAIPPPDRPADHATVEIRFNPELVSFQGFEPSTSGPSFEAASEVLQDTVIVHLKSETAYTVEEFPTGIFIGEITWLCEGEGNTCFYCVGKMSPGTDPWELCLDQKKELDSCICVKIIYPEGDDAARRAGVRGANEVPTIISSTDPGTNNVARCCPVLRVNVIPCALPVATIRARIGREGVINDLPEWRRLVAASDCKRDNCINLTIVPFNITADPTIKGWTLPGPPGDGAIDPSVITAGNNVGAHEIGHALGLNNDHTSGGGDANNLMNETQPHGSNLNAAQCQTIFENLGSYPC